MYTTKLAQFNALMGNIIMTEEDTLYVMLSDEFGQKIPKKFQNSTPESWAKYAFENNKEYFITYYKGDKPRVIVHHTLMLIGLSYYDDKHGELSCFMNIWFKKGYIDNSSKKSKFVSYPQGKIFLGQIDRIGNLGSTLLFYSEKKKNNVFLEEFTEEDGKVELIKQYGTGDLSKHWFDAPKHYLDYEYLLDYEKLFKESSCSKDSFFSNASLKRY